MFLFNVFAVGRLFFLFLAVLTFFIMKLQHKEKVARLVGEFSAGMARHLATLVQSWTEVDECDAIFVEKSFGEISRQLGVDGSPNLNSPKQNMPSPTPCANRDDDIPRLSPNVASTHYSQPTFCPFTTEDADIPMSSPKFSSPFAKNADDIHVASPNASSSKTNMDTSSLCAKKAADIVCPSSHSFSKDYTSDNVEIIKSRGKEATNTISYFYLF